MDSQSVPTSAQAAEHGFDSGKRIKGRKRHMLVDTIGLVLAVMVTTASVSDAQGARQLFRRMGGACKGVRKVWVDATYRGKLVRWVAQHQWFRREPVLRPEGEKGFVLLPRRWVVERTFAWLVQYRRLSKDDERLSSRSEALVYIAMTRVMVRRLAALPPS